MDLLRSFISLFNRSGESMARTNTVGLSIPVCYYGHTYVAQPNSDELKRATFILESRNKNVTKAFSNLLSFYDEATIVLRDNNRDAERTFEVRKIVVSCVDAKHQRLLAVFYDNDSSESSMGMECHLFLCRTKMVAKMVANKIGDKLNKLQVKSEQQTPPKIKLDQVSIMTRPNVSDFDYENINKFFREEVFNLSVQDPSSESSSTYLTTGCDSGRASTVASVDTRSEEIGRDVINPIREDDELEPEVNMDSDGSYKLYPRVKELLSESHVPSHENNNRHTQSTRKSTETSPKRPSSPIVIADKNNNPLERNVRNRYSEPYGLKSPRSKSNESTDDSTRCTRYSHQYELTGVSGRQELKENDTNNNNNNNNNNKNNNNNNDNNDDNSIYKNITIINNNNNNKNNNNKNTNNNNNNTDNKNNNNDNDTNNNKNNNMDNRKKYKKGHECPKKTNIGKNENILDPKLKKSSGEGASHKREKNSQVASGKSSTEGASHSIQNRYSVPYDEQDELVFNTDEDDVFVDKGEKPNVELLDFSELLADSNRDFSVKRIDRRSLHRLTFLSATDI